MLPLPNSKCFDPNRSTCSLHYYRRYDPNRSSQNQRSGLKDAIYRLRSIPEIGLVELSTRDVVRHHLVAKIIRAFDVDKRTENDKEAPSNTTFEEDN